MRKWKLLKTYPGSPELGFELNDRDYNIGLTGTVIINGTFNYDIFNQTEYWEEIIEKPEYVKCITDISNTSYILNKIYKVDEDTDFVIGERSSVARWNNKFIRWSKFEPSTKEAYDEQNKPQLTLSVWCKAIYGYNNFNYYKAVSQSRGESIHSVCWGKGTYCDNDDWSTEFKLVEVLTDLTEIQVYLPDNHVDKIKPKLDYEILSFTSQYPDVKEVCFKHDNGKFGRNWGQRSEHEMLIEVSKNIRKIHSIKRLSDDEIFTINDKVDIYSSIETIEGFSLGMYGDNFLRIKANNKGSYLLENVKTTKELITVQLTKEKYDLLMQLLEE
mgnify:FL=1